LLAVEDPPPGGIGVYISLDRLRAYPAADLRVQCPPSGVAHYLILQPARLPVVGEHRGSAQLPERGVMHEPRSLVARLIQPAPKNGVGVQGKLPEPGVLIETSLR
jgi:hypothetical protein